MISSISLPSTTSSCLLSSFFRNSGLGHSQRGGSGSAEVLNHDSIVSVLHYHYVWVFSEWILLYHKIFFKVVILQNAKSISLPWSFHKYGILTLGCPNKRIPVQLSQLRPRHVYPD